MRPRDEAGAPVMPERLRSENRPDDPAAAADWTHERVEWAKANGVSVLDILREDRRKKAAPR